MSTAESTINFFIRRIAGTPGLPLSTVGPLFGIRDRLPEHFMVMNGDILTDLDYADLLQTHIASGAPVTVATFRRTVKIDFGVLTAADGRDIWLVGGGELVGAFADAGLLDEIILGVAPVTLGAGAPLLPRRLTAKHLTLTTVEQVGQFAYLAYAVGGTGR